MHYITTKIRARRYHHVSQAVSASTTLWQERDAKVLSQAVSTKLRYPGVEVNWALS